MWHIRLPHKSQRLIVSLSLLRSTSVFTSARRIGLNWRQSLPIATAHASGEASELNLSMEEAAILDAALGVPRLQGRSRASGGGRSATSIKVCRAWLRDKGRPSRIAPLSAEIKLAIIEKTALALPSYFVLAGFRGALGGGPKPRAAMSVEPVGACPNHEGEAAPSATLTAIKNGNQALESVH